VGTGKLTLRGDSDAYLGLTTATIQSPSPRARWERPLLHDSNHAPADTTATQSADRRLRGSHLPPQIQAPRSKPRGPAGRALRLKGLRALPAEPLVDLSLQLDRPPPPRLTGPTYS
jgi:hypothetical protein